MPLVFDRSKDLSLANLLFHFSSGNSENVKFNNINEIILLKFCFVTKNRLRHSEYAKLVMIV